MKMSTVRSSCLNVSKNSYFEVGIDKCNISTDYRKKCQYAHDVFHALQSAQVHVLLQGRIQWGAIGAIAIILYNLENYIRDIWQFCLQLFCHSSVVE